MEVLANTENNVIISFHFYTNTSIQTHWHLTVDEGPFQNQIL